MPAEISYRYICVRKDVSGFPEPGDPVWEDLATMELVETEFGSAARLPTTVKAFRSDNSLFFRFDCMDDQVVATYTEHDDPIYSEDVVEVFLSETGSEREYKEFECSPANVRFDAEICNRGPADIQVSKQWHAEGWRTAVHHDRERSSLTYIWELPFANFIGGPPGNGKRWRMNCYRIDRVPGGTDEFSAWSPTGAIDFHRPDKFGVIQFE